MVFILLAPALYMWTETYSKSIDLEWKLSILILIIVILSAIHIQTRAVYTQLVARTQQPFICICTAISTTYILLVAVTELICLAYTSSLHSCDALMIRMALRVDISSVIDCMSSIACVVSVATYDGTIWVG